MAATESGIVGQQRRGMAALRDTVADSYPSADRDDQRAVQGECVERPDTHGWDDVDHLELATLSVAGGVTRCPRG